MMCHSSLPPLPLVVVVEAVEVAEVEVDQKKAIDTRLMDFTNKASRSQPPPI
jgi:hypothetical protein